jgi:hypothetical protein
MAGRKALFDDDFLQVTRAGDRSIGTVKSDLERRRRAASSDYVCRMRMRTIFLAIGAFALLVALLGYLARNAIATKLAAVVLDRKTNIRCSHPDLNLSAALDTLIVSPFSCRIESGPITEFTTEAALIADLSWLRPRSMHVARAGLDQRERDLKNVHMNALQAIAEFTGMTDELVKSMLDGSELYSSDNPALQVDALNVKRGGKHKSIMRNFRKTLDGSWNRTQTDVIDSGASPVSVGDLDMRVTPSRGIGLVSIYFGKRTPGSKADIRLELTGERLDTTAPQVQLRVR